jgi:phosphoglycerol transferase MdoB-like AlkP superfamily enzyme
MKTDITKFWRNSFLVLLGYFSLFRIIFLILNICDKSIPIHTYLIALLHGIRFDISTLAFLIIPIWLLLLLVSFPLFNGRLNQTFRLLLNGYYFIVIPLATIIYIFDTGFFWEYSTRINYLAFEYLDYMDTIIGTIITQFPYNILLFSIPLFIYLEIKFLHKKFKNIPVPEFTKFSQWGGFFLISSIILIIFLRGGFQNKPLNWSHSNFSSFRFTNDLAVNPIWNLGNTCKSYLKEKSISQLANVKITLNESLQLARYKITNTNSQFLKDDFPFLRNSISNNEETDYNIVIILMESFAGQYVGVLGNNTGITPEFDELSNEGILFTQMFSGGTRTNRGIASTLLSFPTLPRYKSILNDASISQSFSSIAQILKQRNYNSNYIFSGDLNYDNMEGFLSTQGFDNFYGRNQFNENAFQTTWGVSDNLLFEKSFQIINDLKEPFLTTILTMTNHPPYLFPAHKSFIPVTDNDSENARLNAFKFSDMALGQFMKKMKSSPIYNRTIFVILGDHGFLSAKFDQNKSIELASYHIPCLIIAPNLEPGINNRLSGQIDIIPTILPLLGGAIVHHSWGKNLLTEPMESDYAIIIPSGINHKIGFIQSNTFLIYDFHSKSEYYTLNKFPNNINLESINNINLTHLKMEKTMLSFLNLASHTLNNYKCGINQY